MVNDKYVDFLEKLIELTKEKKIEWSYLDSNKQLCRNMEWMEGESGLLAITGALSGKIEYAFDFDTERSFYYKKGEIYIVLYATTGNPAVMFLIPSSFKKIVKFSPDKYGDYITRLLNLVENQFPSADAFIDDFLEENK